jgi:hypothetical protein
MTMSAHLRHQFKIEVGRFLLRLRGTVEELVVGRRGSFSVTGAARRRLREEAGNRCRPPRWRNPDRRHQFNPPPPGYGRVVDHDATVSLLFSGLCVTSVLSHPPRAARSGIGTGGSSQANAGGNVRRRGQQRAEPSSTGAGADTFGGADESIRRQQAPNGYPGLDRQTRRGQRSEGRRQLSPRRCRGRVCVARRGRRRIRDRVAGGRIHFDHDGEVLA